MTIVLIVGASSPTVASDPCHDSDGDGWADPEFATDSCPPDNCPGTFNPDQVNCFNVGDPIADGAINVLDVVRSVDYAFRGMMPDGGSGCQSALVGGTDVNCDGETSIVDVVKLVDVAFRGGVDDFCRPCLCDCYPSSCPQSTADSNLLPNNGSFEKLCDSSSFGWLYSSTSGIRIDSIGAPGAGQWSISLAPCWGCAPHVEALVMDAVPGSVFRLEGQYGNGYGPFEWPASGGVSVNFGEYARFEYLWTELLWDNFEIVDTLPMTGSGPLRIRLTGNFNQFGNRTRFDGLRLTWIE
jgi:hypothetical protein